MPGTVHGVQLSKMNTVIHSDWKTRETYARHNVAFIMLARQMDAYPAFCGTEIADGLCSALIEGEAKAHSATLAKSEAILLVEGADQNWFFRLSGIDKAKDIYGRSVGRTTVRGSIEALRKVYGAKKVRLATEAEAKALIKSNQRFDRQSAALAGLL